MSHVCCLPLCIGCERMTPACCVPGHCVACLFSFGKPLWVTGAMASQAVQGASPRLLFVSFVALLMYQSYGSQLLHMVGDLMLISMQAGLRGCACTPGPCPRAPEAGGTCAMT
jgi:hypothetical protein